MSEITKLTLADLDCPLTRAALNVLGHAFVAEAKYPAQFETNNFFEQWKALTSTGIGEFWVARDGSRIVGAIGILFVNDLFSGLSSATEIFWFVSKEARNGGRIGIGLFNQFEKRCDERGVRLRQMAHISGLNDDPLSRLYARRGYVSAERFFRKVT